MREKEEVLDELVRWMEMLEHYKKTGVDSMFTHCEFRIQFLRWVLKKSESF